MNEELRRGFRPTAAPRPVAGLPAAPARGPEPVRRADRAAPNRAPLPAPPPQGPSELAQIAAALGNLQPGLERLVQGYAEGVRQEEQGAAEADATQAALRQDVRSWADAVRADPSLADKSPYYRQIYEGRLARSTIQRQGNEVFARYWQSPLAGSEDPAAIQEWLREQYQDALKPYEGSPAAQAAAAEELRGQAQYLVRTHAQQAARNLVEKNAASFDSAVGAMFDQAHQRGFDREWMAGEVRRLEAEARAQGIDGSTINRVLIQQTQAAMVRHKRGDLAELGRIARPDGTPGFGTTAAGRDAFESANARILSAQVQAANLAYTNAMRERADAERAAHASLADDIFGQLERGQDPAISPDTLRRLARVDPELAGKAMRLVTQTRDFARQDNVPILAALDIGISQGAVSERDLTHALANRQLSPASFRSLLGQLREFRRDGLLNDGSINRIIDEARSIVGDPDQLGGIFRNPEAAASVGMRLRESLILWRKENPQGTLGAAVEHVQKEVERLLPLWSPGRSLDQWRLERMQERGGPPTPAAAPPAGARGAPGGGAAGPQAPGASPPAQRDAQLQPPPGLAERARQANAAQRAQTIEPAAGINWQRQPVFATREELSSAFASWLDNPRDPNNPISRWVVQGGVQDPEKFLQVQLGLIPATRPQQSR